MECKCGSRDFDVVIPSFRSVPYVECYACRRGYLIQDKLKLEPIEIIRNPFGNCLLHLNCSVCGINRIILADNHVVHMIDAQKCRQCSDDAPETTPFGRKLTWDEFAQLQKKDAGV